MYACPLHNEDRRKRVTSEKGILRTGEVDLHLFWDTRKEIDQESAKGATTASDKKRKHDSKPQNTKDDELVVDNNQQAKKKKNH